MFAYVQSVIFNIYAIQDLKIKSKKERNSFIQQWCINQETIKKSQKCM